MMKMRLNCYILLFGVMGLAAGCFKNESGQSPCVPKTVESEMSVMSKYASDSSISAIQDASGLLYQVVDAGTGNAPSAASNITVKYTARKMDGSKVDENLTGVAFPLNTLIGAWQIALPKIKAGGKIKVISPSKLAYGCDTRHPLANQPLYFYIELVSVQ